VYIRIETIIAAYEFGRHENDGRIPEPAKHWNRDFKVGAITVIKRDQRRFLGQSFLSLQTSDKRVNVNDTPTEATKKVQVALKSFC
jgi:hypothetical protein